MWTSCVVHVIAKIEEEFKLLTIVSSNIFSNVLKKEGTDCFGMIKLTQKNFWINSELKKRKIKYVGQKIIMLTQELLKKLWESWKEKSWGRNHLNLLLYRINYCIKVGIDLSDQMISYYSFAEKSVKWHRKIIFKTICTAVKDCVLYNKYYSNKKNQLYAFTELIATSLLEIEMKFTLVKAVSNLY